MILLFIYCVVKHAFRRASIWYGTVSMTNCDENNSSWKYTGNALKWTENWLSDGRQRVVLNGELSKWSDNLSDVQQQSVLGQLLYVIYINDTDEIVKSKLLKFADDTKIYQKINSTEDTDSLWIDLQNLVSWPRDCQ